MSSFLTNHGVVVALVCAACAVVYGLVTTRSLLALSPGNERMQAISLAVQQGARAYLNRQYSTIAIVGVILFVVLGVTLGWATAGGFAVKVVPCQLDRQRSGDQQLSGDQEQPGLRNDLTLDYIVLDSN